MARAPADKLSFPEGHSQEDIYPAYLSEEELTLSASEHRRDLKMMETNLDI